MEPMTIALAAAKALPAVFKGVTGYMAGKAQSKQLRFAANNARAEAAIQAQIQLEDLDRVRARAAVAAASSGGGLQGSAMDVMKDLGRQGMYNVRATLRDGQAKRLAILDQAEAAKDQGTAALVEGLISGGSSFLGDLAQGSGPKAGG